MRAQLPPMIFVFRLEPSKVLVVNPFLKRQSVLVPDNLAEGGVRGAFVNSAEREIDARPTEPESYADGDVRPHICFRKAALRQCFQKLTPRPDAPIEEVFALFLICHQVCEHTTLKCGIRN